MVNINMPALIARSQKLIEKNISRTPSKLPKGYKLENKLRGRNFSLIYLERRLFFAVFLLPLSVVFIYKFFISTDIYLVETQFVIRHAKSSPQQITGLDADSVPIGGLTSSPKLEAGNVDGFAVATYMSSRDAVNRIENEVGLRGMLSRPEADFLSSFPRPFESDSMEDLYRYVQSFIDARYNEKTGIGSLSVRAFRPSDAQHLAQEILRISEERLNQLNERTFNDAILLAQNQVSAKQADYEIQQDKLERFRNEYSIIEPEGEWVSLQRQMTTLLKELNTLQAREIALNAQSPDNPMLATLKSNISALKSEIDRLSDQAAGSTNSLSQKISDYERLALKKTISEKVLVSSMANLKAAEAAKTLSRAYVVPIVAPYAPDAPLVWARYLPILLVGCIGFAVYTSLKFFLRATIERL